MLNSDRTRRPDGQGNGDQDSGWSTARRIGAIPWRLYRSRKQVAASRDDLLARQAHLISILDTVPDVRPFITTKRHGRGVGSSIFEAHGGRIWIEPNPGGGTMFRFTLRAAGNEDMVDAI
jgi:hypothetical protein